MEKIYMEESKRQKKNVMNFSVVLSFVVAIFAVFSLAMAGIVMNQGTGISYAAVTADSFNVKFKAVTAVNDATSKIYGMELYYAGSESIENQVFCIERGIIVSENEEYTKTTDSRPDGQTVESNYATVGNITLSGTPDVSDDPGLLYLLEIGQSSTERKQISNNDYISGWVVQSAIWYYLADVYPDAIAFKFHKSGEDYDDKAVLDSDAVTLKVDGTAIATNQTGLTSKVRELAAAAKTKVSPRVIVSKASDEVSKTEDGKFYQSALITVAGDPSTSFTGYDISLSGIEGAIAVDEEGKELELTNVAAGKKFYVRIPAEKLKEEVQKVEVNVIGHFTSGSVLYYRTSSDSHQRMAVTSPSNINGATEVEFVGTPDTGMNAAQTIYFIGLIVLLCGVGIVYANAKPVEAKQ